MKILAIHGAGFDARIWDKLAEQLPLQALALSPQRASIADMAAFVTQAIDQPVVLMGHSMGALVALEAAQHPQVKGLILLGAAAKMPVHPDLLAQAKNAPEAAAGLILKWGVAPGHDAAQAFVKECMQPSMLGTDLAACDAYQNGETAARAVHIPALVLAGEKDKMVKASDSQALAALMPQGQSRILPGCGHMLMAEDPLETAREIKAFLGPLIIH